MNKNLRLGLRLFLLLSDYLIVSVLFFYFLFFRYDYLYKERTFSTLCEMFNDQFKAYLLLLLSWYLISELTNFYKSTRFLRYINFIRRSIYQLIIFSFILYTVSGIKSESLFTNRQSFYYLLVLAIYLIASRTFLFFFSKHFFEKGFNSKSLIVIGQNDNSSEVINSITDKQQFGLSLKQVFSNGTLNISSLSDYLAKNKIDYGYICLGGELTDKQIKEISELLEDHYVTVGFIPSLAYETQQSLEVNYLDSFPILTYKKHPLDNTFNQLIKRTFDIVFTLLVFATLLWWLLPILAVAVSISQGRPILFAQKRNGLNGKEFDCLKFRTMRPDKENNKKPTERDDPRVTKLGKILRKTSLDELPQFFNVLKGEMSIVGPRPHMVSENESYSEIINRYALRHYVKPGITGLAQVKGYRGAVDTNKDMEMRIRTDIYYVRNWSFLLDLLIIFKTAKLMIFGDENAI